MRSRRSSTRGVGAKSTAGRLSQRRDRECLADRERGADAARRRAEHVSPIPDGPVYGLAARGGDPERIRRGVELGATAPLRGDVRSPWIDLDSAEVEPPVRARLVRLEPQGRGQVSAPIVLAEQAELLA